jgi:nicotinate-nucleotide--dimethylbenzimidazole phosphoribosyltransferase
MSSPLRTTALYVVDAGVNHDFGSRDGLIDRKLAKAHNFAQQAAMSDASCTAALEAGMALAAELKGNVVGFGEMGIGNTTAAAALMHKLTGIPVAECVGAGTGSHQKAYCINSALSKLLLPDTRVL